MPNIPQTILQDITEIVNEFMPGAEADAFYPMGQDAGEYLPREDHIYFALRRVSEWLQARQDIRELWTREG